MPRRVPYLGGTTCDDSGEDGAFLRQDGFFRYESLGQYGCVCRPNLAPDFRVRILALAPTPLTENELDDIEMILSEYLRRRQYEVDGVPFRKQIRNGKVRTGLLDRLEHIKELLAHLEETCSGRNLVDLVAWEKISRAEKLPVHAGAFKQQIERLHRGAEVALQRWDEISKRKQPAEPAFNYLARSLALFFRERGWKVAATKTSRARNPKTSLFVEVVFCALHAMPRRYREHMQSRSALSKALSPFIRPGLLREVSTRRR